MNVQLTSQSQNIYRNRDFETVDPVLHRAWLYSYANKNDPGVVSVIAKSKIKPAGDSTWYLDFTPADLGSTAFIPTNTYCVELGFRFIHDSITYKQGYRANQYIVYSDTSSYDGRVGTFHHTAKTGLTQVIGRGFLESTAQKKIFCPTNLPRR